MFNICRTKTCQKASVSQDLRIDLLGSHDYVVILHDNLGFLSALPLLVLIL